MNIGTVDANNVTVVDDVLGTIAGSPIAVISPGGTVQLTQTQLITADTTNTVTVDGDPQGDGLCNDAAQATVTLEQPNAVPDREN